MNTALWFIRSIESRVHSRKSRKKARAASLSIFDDSEDSSSILCEGVGGETCYPPTRTRRHTRAFCGDPGLANQGTPKDTAPSQVKRTFFFPFLFPPLRTLKLLIQSHWIFFFGQRRIRCSDIFR